MVNFSCNWLWQNVISDEAYKNLQNISVLDNLLCVINQGTEVKQHDINSFALKFFFDALRRKS